MKRLIAIAACCAVAGCTTTTVRVANDIEKPPASSTVLALKPDVELSELTAVGLQQPRADWSAAARDNLSAAIKAALDAKGLKYSTLDPASVAEGRDAQLLRLNTAVNDSILVYNLSFASLPTHKGAFNWTLGDGAGALAADYKADYALYVMARGDWSTSGRKLAFLMMAAGGVSLPMGGQGLLVSLVDLKTGRVIWYNLAHAGPDDDMRTAEGAGKIVATVLKSAPF
jgi:hypothetical protein